MAADQSQHTPGPWEWSHHRIWSGVNEVLSVDTYDGGSGRINITQADADLIVRAPDLLAENERLREALRIVASNMLALEDEVVVTSLGWSRRSSIARAALGPVIRSTAGGDDG